GELDGNTLTGTRDFFVTKYDSAGTKQYTRQLGVAAADTYGNSVATDASGNVYVAGYTNGGLDGNTLTGTRDFFVTKYNSAGTKQHTKQLGVAAANTYGYSVATDDSGNVYVAGQTSGNLDGVLKTGIVDFFVTKYDSAGSKQYTKLLGVTEFSTRARSVTTDASGNVYVIGDTDGGLDGNTLTGLQDFFVTKYDSVGTKQYTKLLGVAGVDTGGRSVATDDSGNVYVAGVTFGGLDGNTLVGTSDTFVTKYDSAGVKQ
ncbi:MAG: SBBP repeat-containing protein, partial [Desulfobulbaceae bacterium]|nr:SBBP repeat-containing protein [Desulfobulbaceae bacterium]